MSSEDSPDANAHAKAAELPSLDGVPDAEDPPSITEVGGTVARFDMSYEPPAGERRKFGPPFRSRWPSLVYLAVALGIEALVVWGYNAPSTSRVFRWIVEGDRNRPLGSQTLAAIVVVSAIATVIRAHMRGVILSADWIEARHLLPMGIPRALRWGWPQVQRVIVDTNDGIALELVDGSWERLPDVAAPAELRKTIVAQALKRQIDVTELRRESTSTRGANA